MSTASHKTLCSTCWWWNSCLWSHFSPIPPNKSLLITFSLQSKQDICSFGQHMSISNVTNSLPVAILCVGHFSATSYQINGLLRWSSVDIGLSDAICWCSGAWWSGGDGVIGSRGGVEGGIRRRRVGLVLPLVPVVSPVASRWSSCAAAVAHTWSCKVYKYTRGFDTLKVWRRKSVSCWSFKVLFAAICLWNNLWTWSPLNSKLYWSNMNVVHYIVVWILLTRCWCHMHMTNVYVEDISSGTWPFWGHCCLCPHRRFCCNTHRTSWVCGNRRCCTQRNLLDLSRGSEEKTEWNVQGYTVMVWSPVAALISKEKVVWNLHSNILHWCQKSFCFLEWTCTPDTIKWEIQRGLNLTHLELPWICCCCWSHCCWQHWRCYCSVLNSVKPDCSYVANWVRTVLLLICPAVTRLWQSTESGAAVW